MKTFLISLLTVFSLMAAGSASAQISQNWTLAQCQKAWRYDKKHHFFPYQMINNVEVSPIVKFSDNVLVAIKYQKNSAEDFTEDEVNLFLLENAPDAIWLKEENPNDGAHAYADFLWTGIDRISREVKYSAFTFAGYHGSASLQINRGTKFAPLWEIKGATF